MQPGRTLLHYRLVDKIGEGGMGVVWKAQDTTLDREVAIKVLPEIFARDPERLARFEREAKLLASLNHPNIATVYGLHAAQDDGRDVRFLAMELVEGQDLATRLERGPLGVDESLRLAVQVAAAMEAAHAQGVIHRDLKPANVMLDADGKVKVLDFGLAKAMEPDPMSASGSLSMSPTITSAGTAAGMILGTAAYMSPEQARGKPVDRRADLWSFGVLLYECLTGVQLFRGETVSDSLAAILRKDPDWSALPGDTPPLVRLLVRRCLTRDPGQRLQDAGDARLELEQALEDPRGELLGLAPGGEATRPGSRWRARLPWLVAVLALLVALYAGTRGPRTGSADVSRRLMIPVPGPTAFGDLVAAPPVLSPDGRYVVLGITDGGGMRLWLRALDQFDGRFLDDTDGAEFPFWSPDSRYIGFSRGGKLMSLELATGLKQSIGGPGSSAPRGASWNGRGQIIFSPTSNSGIYLIDAGGGAARQITALDPDIPDCSHRWPSFLPDGEHFLFVLWSNDLQAQQERGGVFVASISGKEEPQRVVPEASSASYAPPGFLFLLRGDNLIAIPFDAEKRRVTGEARVLAGGVMRNRGNGHGVFSVSREGTLVYAVGSDLRPATPVWYERSGKRSEAGIEAGAYSSLRLSPDASRAAAAIVGPSGDNELWTLDFGRGVRTRLASGAWTYEDPVWDGAGERLLYESQEGGSLNFRSRRADGSGGETPVLVDDQDKVLYDWSRDGKYIAYWPMGGGSGTSDLWIYSVERQAAEPFVGGDADYGEARFSPDSRWVAYSSDDSGRGEVFVQVLLDDGGVKAGARFQVSTAGGRWPHWRDDGREIVYLGPQQRVMAVAVEPQGNALALSPPRELFRVEETITAGDVAGDHQRFLFTTRDNVASEPVHVILNWPADLQR